MGLRKYDGDLTWDDLAAGLIQVSDNVIRVMYEARELREDFRVVAGSKTDAEIASELNTTEQAIVDARAAVGALHDLFKIFEGDVGVTIENFADKLRKFS